MSTESVSSAATQVIGKDVFMKMLLAQLKNQDPLNPLDGTDFAAQLAQFSSLEQLTNVSSQLESLSGNISAMNNSQMAGLIGCGVTSDGNQILADGTQKTLSYTLPEDAVKGNVNIYDESGALVKTLEFGTQAAGTNSVTWDSSGLSGTYNYAVSGLNKNGSQIIGSTYMTGTVSGINYKNGSTYLIVNGQQIAFSDVVAIRK